MEFRHLVSFLAIAEELHFGRAAARLHLTQPSLSQQLQRLERTLGVELVARTSHEVRLTPAGRAFEVEARVIVAQMDKAVQSVREVAAGRIGTVRVGYNFPAGQHILPVTLAKMHAEFADVTVRLEEKRTGPQLQALADGDLDIALVYGTSRDQRVPVLATAAAADGRGRRAWPQVGGAAGCPVHRTGAAAMHPVQPGPESRDVRRDPVGRRTHRYPARRHARSRRPRRGRDPRVGQALGRVRVRVEEAVGPFEGPALTRFEPPGAEPRTA